MNSLQSHARMLLINEDGGSVLDLLTGNKSKNTDKKNNEINGFFGLLGNLFGPVTPTKEKLTPYQEMCRAIQEERHKEFEARMKDAQEKRKKLIEIEKQQRLTQMKAADMMERKRRKEELMALDKKIAQLKQEAKNCDDNIKEIQKGNILCVTQETYQATVDRVRKICKSIPDLEMAQNTLNFIDNIDMAFYDKDGKWDVNGATKRLQERFGDNWQEILREQGVNIGAEPSVYDSPEKLREILDHPVPSTIIGEAKQVSEAIKECNAADEKIAEIDAYAKECENYDKTKKERTELEGKLKEDASLEAKNKDFYDIIKNYIPSDSRTENDEKNLKKLLKDAGYTEDEINSKLASQDLDLSSLTHDPKIIELANKKIKEKLDTYKNPDDGTRYIEDKDENGNPVFTPCIKNGDEWVIAKQDESGKLVPTETVVPNDKKRLTRLEAGEKTKQILVDYKKDVLAEAKCKDIKDAQSKLDRMNTAMDDLGITKEERESGENISGDRLAEIQQKRQEDQAARMQKHAKDMKWSQFRGDPKNAEIFSNSLTKDTIKDDNDGKGEYVDLMVDGQIKRIYKKDIPAEDPDAELKRNQKFSGYANCAMLQQCDPDMEEPEKPTPEELDELITGKDKNGNVIKDNRKKFLIQKAQNYDVWVQRKNARDSVEDAKKNAGFTDDEMKMIVPEPKNIHGDKLMTCYKEVNGKPVAFVGKFPNGRPVPTNSDGTINTSNVEEYDDDYHGEDNEDADKNDTGIDTDEKDNDGDEDKIDGATVKKDIETVDGKKKLVNPKHLWKKRKLKDGTMSSAYYKHGNANEESISKEDYQKKVNYYNKRKQQKQKEIEGQKEGQQGQQNDSLQYDMTLTQYLLEHIC